MENNMKKWLIVLMMAAGAATCSAAEVKNDDGLNIYFARHGKTLLNTFDRVQGWADSPLTEDGIRVARYLGEGLKGIPFDSFYSSDAGRQRETMQVILKEVAIKWSAAPDMTPQTVLYRRPVAQFSNFQPKIVSSWLILALFQANFLISGRSRLCPYQLVNSNQVRQGE